MLRKLYALISIIIFLIPCILSIFFPRVVSSLAVDGLRLCINSIVPSLFPFMVTTQLLTRTGIVHTIGSCLSGVVSPILGVNRNLCGAVLIGTVGGFPNGAHSVGLTFKDGYCSKTEAERAIALCNNCSLIYICSVAGSLVLGSIKAGIIFLIAEALSIISASVILRIINRHTHSTTEVKYQRNKESFSTIICKSITESGLNTLNMCSYIVFFYIISGLISCVLPKSTLLQAVVKGLFELSGGVKLCTDIDFPLNYVICSAIIGFSGISVIFQVCDVCEKYKLSSKEFVISRLINLIFMPLYTIILLVILPREAIYVSSDVNYSNAYSSAISSHLIILYSVVILFVVGYIRNIATEKKYFRQKQ